MPDSSMGQESHTTSDSVSELNRCTAKFPYQTALHFQLPPQLGSFAFLPISSLLLDMSPLSCSILGSLAHLSLHQKLYK